MNKKPLIISTDPGIDDAVCLTIALFAKELDIKLIVPTWGNVSLDKTLNNTLRLQKFLGTKVPVVAGAKLPLVKEAIDASEVHGASGMDGYDFPEADESLLVSGLAATKIHEVVNASEDKVTLMQIGPATDFALYFRQYPEDLDKIDALYIMGGALGRGNYGPYDEYNVSGDPEAAKIVFDLGKKLPIYVAPLEVGNQAFVEEDTLQEIKALGPVGEMVYGLNSHYEVNDPAAAEGKRIYDALTAAMLLAPDLFEVKDAYVAVDTKGPLTYGASVMDFDGFFGQANNAHVAVSVDREAFKKWFVEAIAQANK
ncbi:Cytidine/uridine-specific hydrolase [Lactobacillus equicursoris 66c]|uniref:Cytidine/uridine-specific hydrolase n=1 Tax=Lactobacillus equicursoris 66c TaxID=872326 RepID=K0NRI2_9LACO|nr:nucleoside hydrolase [Lactobacillus equicursoris]CCK83653.1 Cytidine/uridine-specific hydrolase [Lactobacillus equicursoris 66c]CCK83865.1 Cytidine/uridine-specific hydrolase [Lactobacillus equicursoris 66c]